jgi:nucleoside-diphosphate-sugar epimerase
MQGATSDSAIIIGCGYIGRRLAARLRDAGTTPVGVVRNAASAAALAEQGVPAIRCDLDLELLPSGSTSAKDVYYLAPPPGEGVRDTRIQRFLDGLAHSGQPRRILYISTTGVYGDCKGEWVDETRPPNPQVDRARRRWHAEQLLQDWRRRSGGGLVILRVAGIYGPGKLPLARLRKRVPMVAESDAPWTNRIHADDLVSACVAAMRRGLDGQAYNACDGTPGNMTDYFNRVADMAGMERPPLISLQQARQELSPGLLSYLGESRRLSNARLLRDTGLQLRYPDLASGLPACFP